MGVCATPNCEITLTMSDVAQGFTHCSICRKREQLKSVEGPASNTVPAPVSPLVKPVLPASAKIEIPDPQGKQEVPVAPVLPQMRRSNSMSKVHAAVDYVVASLRLKATGMEKPSYFGEFSSDPEYMVPRVPEYAEMFSQTKLKKQGEYTFPYNKEEWAVSCEDAEAQLLNYAYLKVKNIIMKWGKTARFDVEIHTNKGPCNGCKNRIERAAVGWANWLKDRQQLFVTGFYLQPPDRKRRGALHGQEGVVTDYGIPGSEPAVSYGAVTKESGLYVIRYWPR